MTGNDRDELRRRLEARAEREGWTRRFRVAVKDVSEDRSETVEVPGRDARHASRTNAMFLLEMLLRGQTVEYEVEEVN